MDHKFVYVSFNEAFALQADIALNEPLVLKNHKLVGKKGGKRIKRSGSYYQFDKFYWVASGTGHYVMHPVACTEVKKGGSKLIHANPCFYPSESFKGKCLIELSGGECELRGIILGDVSGKSQTKETPAALFYTDSSGALPPDSIIITDVYCSSDMLNKYVHNQYIEGKKQLIHTNNSSAVSCVIDDDSGIPILLLSNRLAHVRSQIGQLSSESATITDRIDKLQTGIRDVFRLMEFKALKADKKKLDRRYSLVFPPPPLSVEPVSDEVSPPKHRRSFSEDYCQQRGTDVSHSHSKQLPPIPASPQIIHTHREQGLQFDFPFSRGELSPSQDYPDQSLQYQYELESIIRLSGQEFLAQ